MRNSSEKLNENEWHDVLFGLSGEAVDAVKRVSDGYNKQWHKPVLDKTCILGKVFETVSETGQMSAALAENGRDVTLLDFSFKNLVFSRLLFKHSRVEGEYVLADMLKPFPFADNSFECVWSEGVLEHFSEEEIIRILQESRRVSGKTVISMVPNAFSLAYRFGKWYQELRGYWRYGRENPKLSLRKQFQAAGLSVVREYSIDPFQSFEFLVMLKKKPFGEFLLRNLNNIPVSFLNYLNQGWLLITVGEKI